MSWRIYQAQLVAQLVEGNIASINHSNYNVKCLLSTTCNQIARYEFYFVEPSLVEMLSAMVNENVPL